MNVELPVALRHFTLVLDAVEQPLFLLWGPERHFHPNRALCDRMEEAVARWRGMPLKGQMAGLELAMLQVETGEETRLDAAACADLLPGLELLGREVRLSPLKDDEGRVLGAVGSLVRAAGRLVWESVAESDDDSPKVRENDLAQVVSGIPHLVWRAREDGRVNFMSAQAALFSGFRRMDDGTVDWTGIVHPEDRARSIAAWEQAVASGAPYQCDHRLRLADGSYRWFFSSAVPHGSSREDRQWFGTASDIEREVQAQASLKESEARFRALADGLPLMVWLHDAEGRQVYVNRTFCEYFGVERRAMIGNRWQELVHPEDLEPYGLAFREAVREAKPFEGEVRVRSPDGGSWRHLKSWGRPLTDDSGVISGYIGTSADISDRKAIEEALREAREAAEASNQAKGEFLANMSHEIRTPMTAILGYADILERSLEDGDHRNCIDIIRRNGKFLLELINDILDLSRIEAGRMQIEPQPVALVEFAREIISLLEPGAAEKQLELSVDLQTPLPEQVRLDPVRMRQVLINLLGNAIKFTPEGRVTLHVRWHEEEQQLEWTVRDTGIGIAREDLEVLFAPFIQIDSSAARAAGGTGLGLAICRRLTEMMGGSIAVESEKGAGSVFRVRLPGTGIEDAPLLTEIPPASEAAALRPTLDLPPLEGLFLVIDDRREVRQLHEYQIQEAGGFTVSASSGEEALRLWEVQRERGLPWKAVLMDVQMPDLDGLETTRRLRQAGLTAPVIALTAHAMKGDGEKCLRAGCNAYLAKPVTPEILIGTIREVLAAEQADADGESPPEPPPEPEPPSVRLLLVEDSDGLRKVLEQYFRRAGFEIRAVAGFRAAAEAATEFLPEVVLADLGLPDRSGLELPETLRSLPGLDDISLVALSGRDEPEDRQRSLESGFDDHFIKPPAFSELKRRLEDLAESVRWGRQSIGSP